MEIEIRLAKPEDLASIIALMEEHARYEHAKFSAEGLVLKLERAMNGKRPRLSIYVAEIQQQIVAYCAVTLEFSTWQASEYLHLDCLYTVSEWRGYRIGANMFARAVSFAREMNVSEIQWQTPDWNEDAIRFYQRLGARNSAKRRFSYRVA